MSGVFWQHLIYPLPGSQLCMRCSRVYPCSCSPRIAAHALHQPECRFAEQKPRRRVWPWLRDCRGMRLIFFLSKLISPLTPGYPYHATVGPSMISSTLDRLRQRQASREYSRSDLLGARFTRPSRETPPSGPTEVPAPPREQSGLPSEEPARARSKPRSLSEIRREQLRRVYLSGYRC